MIESVDVDGRLREVYCVELEVQIQRQRSRWLLQLGDPFRTTVHSKATVVLHRSSSSVHVRSLIEEVLLGEPKGTDTRSVIANATIADVLVLSLIVARYHASFDESRLVGARLVRLDDVRDQTRASRHIHVAFRQPVRLSFRYPLYKRATP